MEDIQEKKGLIKEKSCLYLDGRSQATEGANCNQGSHPEGAFVFLPRFLGRHWRLGPWVFIPWLQCLFALQLWAGLAVELPAGSGHPARFLYGSIWCPEGSQFLFNRNLPWKIADSLGRSTGRWIFKAFPVRVCPTWVRAFWLHWL